MILPVLLLATCLASSAPGVPAVPRSQEGGADALARLFSDAGVRLDAERGLCAIEAEVEVKDELLEYVLVGPGGARHESLVTTPVTPSILNAALLSLGVAPGENAIWTPRDPPPTREERRQGIPAYDVTPPSGDGFLLYVAWREGQETYFFRLEDLLTNLRTDRRMQRHRWVFLGSRFLPAGEGEEERFAADVEQNLINVSFFHEGHTLVTASLPECVEQTIWMANPWLLPPRGSRVLFVFSRTPLVALPKAWEEGLPTLEPEASPGASEG